MNRPAPLCLLTALGLSLGLLLPGCRKAAPPVPAQPVSDALQLVPDDALFCLRLARLEQTSADLDTYCLGLLPVTPGMMLRLQLGKLLGDPQLQGLRLDGDLVVFGRATTPSDLTLAALLPIQDAAAFREHAPQCQPTDDPGVLSLEAQGLPPLYLAPLANYVLICPDARALDGLRSRLATQSRKVTGSLAQATPALPGTTAAVWAYADIPALDRLYGPLLRTQLDALKAKMTKALNQAEARGGQTASAGSLASLDMVRSALDTALAQLRVLTLELHVAAESLRLRPTVQARPATALDRTLQAAAPRTGPDLVTLLPAESVMSFRGDPQAAFGQSAWAVFETWLQDAMTAPQIASLREVVDRAGTVFNGPGVGSMIARPGLTPWFSLEYALPCAGRDAVRRFLRDGLRVTEDSGLSRWYADQFGVGMAFDFQESVSEHAGVPIDALTLRFTAADPNAPVLAAIRKMYGEGFHYRLAVRDTLFLLAVGPDAEAAIVRLIDRAAQPSPGPAPAEFQAALDSLPDSPQAAFVATYNYLRIMRAVRGILPAKLPEIPVQTQSNLTFAGYRGQGRAGLDIVVPKQHLLEIAQYVMALQMQLRQQTQPHGDSPTGPAAP